MNFSFKFALQSHRTPPSSPTRSVKNHALRGTLCDPERGAESVEIILVKEPFGSHPTTTRTTAGLVLTEDPIRSWKGSYQLVTISSSSEDTDEFGDELVGLQYLPEDE